MRCLLLLGCIAGFTARFCRASEVREVNEVNYKNCTKSPDFMRRMASSPECTVRQACVYFSPGVNMSAGYYCHCSAEFEFTDYPQCKDWNVIAYVEIILILGHEIIFGFLFIYACAAIVKLCRRKQFKLSRNPGTVSVISNMVGTGIRFVIVGFSYLSFYFEFTTLFWGTIGVLGPIGDMACPLSLLNLGVLWLDTIDIGVRLNREMYSPKPIGGGRQGAHHTERCECCRTPSHRTILRFSIFCIGVLELILLFLKLDDMAVGLTLLTAACACCTISFAAHKMITKLRAANMEALAREVRVLLNPQSALASVARWVS